MIIHNESKTAAAQLMKLLSVPAGSQVGEKLRDDGIRELMHGKYDAEDLETMLKELQTADANMRDLEKILRHQDLPKLHDEEDEKLLELDHSQSAVSET